MIIFSPSKGFLAENERLKVRLTGHSGALYIVRKRDDGSKYPSPVTGSGEEDQNAWHDGLRTLMGKISRPETLLAKVQKYALDNVWDGRLKGLDPDQPIKFVDGSMKRLKDRDGTKLMTVGELAARQTIYHLEMMDTLLNAQKAMRKFDTK